MTETYALITAVFSAIATFLAAFATWRSPLAAAKLAERLRQDGDRGQERQKNKLVVFAMLMQERAAIYSENGVRALNLIDVVFNESRDVREAWAELFLAFDTTLMHLPKKDLSRIWSVNRHWLDCSIRQFLQQIQPPYTTHLGPLNHNKSYPINSLIPTQSTQAAFHLFLIFRP